MKVIFFIYFLYFFPWPGGIRKDTCMHLLYNMPFGLMFQCTSDDLFHTFTLVALLKGVLIFYLYLACDWDLNWQPWGKRFVNTAAIRSLWSLLNTQYIIWSRIFKRRWIVALFLAASSQIVIISHTHILCQIYIWLFLCPQIKRFSWFAFQKWFFVSTFAFGWMGFRVSITTIDRLLQ